MKKVLKFFMILLLLCSTVFVTRTVAAEGKPTLPKKSAVLEKDDYEELPDTLALPEGKRHYDAEPRTDINNLQLTGKAYAIFVYDVEGQVYQWEEDGDLIFFRSTENYEDGVEYDNVVINGKSYSGTVYADFENKDPWDETTESYNLPTWYDIAYYCEHVYVAEGHKIQPISTAGWFYEFSYMFTFDGTGFDMTNCYDMYGMFMNCQYMDSPNLSGWNTKNVVEMSVMFAECEYAYDLDLSSFNTAKVKSMYAMFAYTDAIFLNLSSFSTAAVEDMSRMFEGSTARFVKLGKKWTNWTDEAYLPEGNWRNRELSLTKTEAELYAGYPSNASPWKGLWVRDVEEYDYLRVYEESRLAESIEAAAEMRSNLGMGMFNSVIVAKDSDFADALSGSYLAARKNAPILLVNDSNLAEAQEYIGYYVRVGGTVYILGGDNAVSYSFEEGVNPNVKVKRLEGSSRYMTNLEILKEAGMTSSGDIFVVTGLGYADSLSSASVGLPILMVDNNSTSLKNSQKKFLQANVTGKIYILGDTNAVNASLAKELKAYGSVTRIGGSSRWETTKLIAQKFFTNPKYVTLATGNDFADGLIASPLAYALKSPLIMCSTEKTYQAKLYVQAHPVSKAYIVGSTENISDEAARKILLLEDGVPIVDIQ